MNRVYLFFYKSRNPFSPGRGVRKKENSPLVQKEDLDLLSRYMPVYKPTSDIYNKITN